MNIESNFVHDRAELNYAQAAQYLYFSARTLRRHVRKGTISCNRNGGRVAFTYEQLDSFRDSRGTLSQTMDSSC